MGLRFSASVVMAVIWLAASFAPASAGGPPVVRLPSDDAAMKAAIDRAREGLPQFWERLANPAADERGFAVKLAISDEDVTEYFWLVDLKRDGKEISGAIGNAPAMIGIVRLGERVRFTEEEIADWTYVRGDKMVGNETMRPLLRKMSRSQAEQFRSLYETP
jgi:uncharacterized protein YegJ (DUF2314 family)